MIRKDRWQRRRRGQQTKVTEQSQCWDVVVNCQGHPHKHTHMHTHTHMILIKDCFKHYKFFYDSIILTEKIKKLWVCSSNVEGGHKTTQSPICPPSFTRTCFISNNVNRHKEGGWAMCFVWTCFCGHVIWIKAEGQSYYRDKVVLFHDHSASLILLAMGVCSSPSRCFVYYRHIFLDMFL